MVNYQLCPKLSGLRKVNCNEESEQQCSGACKNEEDNKSYNQKVKSFLDQIKVSQKEILLEFEGREKSEKAYCVFDRGVLTKFGFIKDLNEKEDLISRLESVPRIPETYYILRQFFPKFQADQIRILESV
jgi:DNA polymerase-3 subunit epsilon